MKQNRAALRILVAGALLFAASYYPNFWLGNDFWGDMLEVAGTGLLVVGACFIVRRLAAGSLAARFVYAGGLCLVLARLGDFTAEIDALAGIPLIGDRGWGQKLLVRILEGAGYTGILLAFVKMLVDLSRLREEADQARHRLMELHEESLYLARVADMSAEAVISCDTGGIIRTWNRSAQTLFGYATNEATGKRLDELFAGGLRDRAGEPVDCAAVSCAVQDIEAAGMRSDGTEFTAGVSYSPLHDDAGRNVGLSIVVRDIEEQVQAEHELITSRNLLANVLQNASVGMFVLDRKCHILEYNKRMETITGWKKEELDAVETLGEVSQKLLDSALDLSEVFAEKVLVSGESAEFPNLAIRHADGSTRVVHVTVCPVLDDRGAAVGAAGIMVDITDRQELQARLLASQKMESLGRLAGGIAHDFNNILGGILGYASLMGSKVSDNPTLSRYTGAIQSAATRAAELTHQLLAFARGKPSQTTEVDMNTIVEETTELLVPSLDANVKIAFAPGDNLELVRGDASQMKQMLMNLLLNARDALDNNGRIDVCTHTVNVDETLAQRLNVSWRGPAVCLSIEDNGSGMTPDVVQRVFEPFFSTKGTQKGYGLGLSVVYGIVESHDGSIVVDSEPGHGTHIHVYLPAVAGLGHAPQVAERQAPPMPSTSAHPHHGSETVLVVDDEAMMRALARDVLETAGYSVITVASGEEALELYRERGDEIDAVIMDLLMPGMSGSEAIKGLRTMNPNLRCIVSSGCGDDAMDAFQKDSGIRFIPKPYQAGVLMEGVRELLDSEAA